MGCVLAIFLRSRLPSRYEMASPLRSCTLSTTVSIRRSKERCILEAVLDVLLAVG